MKPGTLMQAVEHSVGGICWTTNKVALKAGNIGKDVIVYAGPASTMRQYGRFVHPRLGLVEIDLVYLMELPHVR